MPFTPPLFELFLCAVLVLSVRALFGRRLGPRCCRALWAVLILRALIPVSIPVSSHPFAWPAALLAEIGIFHPMSDRTAEPEPSVIRGYPSTEDTFEWIVPPSEPVEETQPTDPKARSGMVSFGFPETARPWLGPVIFICWVGGALSVLMIALIRNRRLVARATRNPVATPDWVQTFFLESRKSLRLGTWPVLIVSPCVPAPCLVGALRPRILIPESLLDGAENETERKTIRYMMLHELVHLKHGDIWFSWCWTLAFAVNWYNPLFWLLGRSVAFDCETACDERVLSSLPKRNHDDYASSLLVILRSLRPPPPRLAGMSAIIETPTPLERRIAIMKTYQKPGLLHRAAAFCAPILLLAIVFTAYAEPRKPLPAEKARLMGHVEDYLMNNGRDITMRRSLAWGEPAKDKDGNAAITYKYVAEIWGRERVEIEERYTFAPDGTFVRVEKIAKKPAETAHYAPIEETPETVAAGAFLAEVAAERFAKARELCNAEMQTAMPEAMLKKIWAGQKTMYGKWLETKPVKQETLTAEGAEYVRVYEECTFERGRTILMVVLDTEHKITGLFIVGAETISSQSTSGSAGTADVKSTAQTAAPVPAATVKVDIKRSQSATAAGWQLFMKGEFAEAEEKFQEGVLYNPKFAAAYQGLGWAQRNLGKTEEAKENFETCLKLDPKNVAALNGLGQIALMEGDEEKAIEYWTKGLADPKASGPAYALAEIYMKRGDYPKAVELYRKAVKAEPQNEDIKEALKNAMEAAEAAKEEK